MRVLVTGASGFVGSVLCADLTRRGALVRRAVRSPDGDIPETVAVGDVGPRTDWRAALDGVDAVVHLAARVHVVRDSAASPLSEYRRVNIEGTRQLAQAAAQAGVRRLLLVSSIKVNGEVTRRPFTEDDPPKPVGAYAISKWEAEQALIEASGRLGLEWVVLRPPLVYGPGVGANFLGLLHAVATRRPLPLGAIENRRSLAYVGNLVDAIHCCLVQQEAANRTFLIGDGEDVSTPDLVRRLACALGVSPRLLRVPVPLLRTGGWLVGQRAAIERLAGSLQVDSGRLRSVLGWVPPHGLEQGLAATARWYRDTVASREKC